jgi:hypothetical protein
MVGSYLFAVPALTLLVVAAAVLHRGGRGDVPERLLVDPPVRVFATTLVGLLGALALVNAGRSRRPGRTAPGLLASGVVVAGVAVASRSR